MSVITYDFIKKIVNNYDFFNLLNVTNNKLDRMCLERIFGLICHALKPNLKNSVSIFGIQYEKSYSYNDYLISKNKNTLNKKIVHIFTKR
jgi:6-pyruvoyl-tetrahydropterin synthase